MKYILKLEELAEFLFAIALFNLGPYEWWWFPALLLLPDASMIGYLIGNKAGACCYNFFHHKGTGLVCFCAGLALGLDWLSLTGIIIFAHSCMDRLFGYGLKYEDGFRFTHLGVIGKQKEN